MSQELNCAKCEGTAMAVLSVAGVEVDRCPKCQGIWFDKRELKELLAMDATLLEPLMGGDNKQTDSVKGHCPRCKKRLLRVCSLAKRDVILDTCAFCEGIWCDGGEFEEIRKGM